MVISGDREFEQLLELYDTGKTDELRALLDSHRISKLSRQTNSSKYETAVTREMGSISIDSNFSDGNPTLNDYVTSNFDVIPNRLNRSFSNSSFAPFNSDSQPSGGKQTNARRHRASK